MKEDQLFNTRPGTNGLSWCGSLFNGTSPVCLMPTVPLGLFGPSGQFIQMAMAVELRQR